MIRPVTDKQIAGVAGLLIAGIGITAACRIMRVWKSQRHLLRQRLPTIPWDARFGRRKTTVSKNIDKEALRLDYIRRDMNLDTIGAKYGVSERMIRYYAKEGGWGRKPFKGGPGCRINPIKSWPKERRLLYYKLVKGGLSHAVAKQEALRDV